MVLGFGQMQAGPGGFDRAVEWCQIESEDVLRIR